MPSSLQQAVGNTLALGFDGLEAPKELLQAARNQQIAGFILFRRNIADHEQARAQIQSIRKTFPGLPPLACVDQEGGRVARFSEPVLKLPAMRRFGEIDDTEWTQRGAQLLAKQLRWIGINLNFAPVLDIDSNPQNPIIGERAFGRTADVVIRHARAFAQGLQAEGIVPVGKHFPGHGDTDVDSHLALPVVTKDLTQLEALELLPFTRLASSLPALMSAHILFTALDAQRPATLSHAIMTDLLRNKMQFQGVAISDDLEMKAVQEKWGIEGAGIEAIGAGCDLLLVCSKLEEGLELYAALCREAERSSIFREKILQASHRITTLRKRIANDQALSRNEEDFPERAAREYETELEVRMAGIT